MSQVMRTTEAPSAHPSKGSRGPSPAPPVLGGLPSERPVCELQPVNRMEVPEVRGQGPLHSQGSPPLPHSPPQLQCPGRRGRAGSGSLDHGPWQGAVEGADLGRAGTQPYSQPCHGQLGSPPLSSAQWAWPAGGRSPEC